MTSAKYITAALIMVCGALAAQIPVLNSNPSITDKVIYLDFDGQKVTGTAWNNGNTINAAASTVGSANFTLIWKRVSEDYRPFDVNVTTDSARFNAANPVRRIRVVFTPTSAWYGSAGGVAYVGSFAWGGTPGTPCWVFENQLGYSTKNMAEAAAHECGHTLSLYHQSTYSSACAKTNEYHPGLGSGVTSWAPIMGVGYSKNVTIWHNGHNSNSCTAYQLDHGNATTGITGPNFLNFLPDDIGNTYSSAKIMNLNNLTTLDSGLITTPSDIDAFRFNICANRYVTIAVKPWALDTVNYSGANLDIRLNVYNAANNQLALDTTISRLHAICGLSLTPGSYYFTIDGGGSANYSDYGSLGRYYVTVKATNPPSLAPSIPANNSLCANQTSTLNGSSTGSPTGWLWNISGPSSASFNIQNPTYTFSPGVYTITLTSNNATATSCPFTQTVNAGNLPFLNPTSSQSVICAPGTAILSASGASSYTWMPGGSSNPNITVTPSVTTNYTLTGANGNCAVSQVLTQTVNPKVNLTASVSKNLACYGETITITGGGATSYTFNPGNITSNPASFVVTDTTVFTISGGQGPCVKSMTSVVNVIPEFTVDVYISNASLCLGQQVLLQASGADTFTFYPGGSTTNPTVFTPLVPTTYTVVGSMAGVCYSSSYAVVNVSLCDVGLGEVSENKDIRIFPNPAGDRVHIEGGSSCSSIQIFDHSGKLVWRSGEKSADPDVSAFARGIYFVTLKFSDREAITEKLIID